MHITNTLLIFTSNIIRSLKENIIWSILFLALIHFPIFANNAITTFKVNTLGTANDKTQQIILIPGLMSDGRVWTDIANELAEVTKVHVVSLAGFAGTKKVEHQSLFKVKQQLFQYIEQQKLINPTIIGHSLGGFMAFWMATTNSEAIGSIISIDGLPFIGPVFTRSNESTIESLKSQADYIKQFYAQMTTEQLVTQTKYGIASQVSNENGKRAILDMAATSDPKTVGDAIYTLMKTDLRQSLGHINNPTLLIGAAGGFTNEDDKSAAKLLYQQQLANLDGAKLVMNNNSRHFIMFDQPDWLSKQIFQFLDFNKKSAGDL
jgi:pimeloyl-ACP methyl ester carboxylesterase